MGAHLSVPMYRRSLRQRLLLEGQRCSACGRLQFPPTARCPACWGDRLGPARLTGRGVIEALTRIAAAGAPPEFTPVAGGGYCVAIIRLEEGLRITAQLTGGWTPGIGRPVRAVIRRLYVEDGVIRYGFKFEPDEEVVGP